MSLRSKSISSRRTSTQSTLTPFQAAEIKANQIMTKLYTFVDHCDIKTNSKSKSSSGSTQFGGTNKKTIKCLIERLKREKTNKIFPSSQPTNGDKQFMTFMSFFKETIINKNSLVAIILLQDLDIDDIYMVLTETRPLPVTSTIEFIKKLDSILNPYRYKKNLFQFTLYIYRSKDDQYPIKIAFFKEDLREENGNGDQFLYNYRPESILHDYAYILELDEQPEVIKKLHNDIQTLTYINTDFKMVSSKQIVKNNVYVYEMRKTPSKLKNETKQIAKEYLMKNTNIDSSVREYAKELKTNSDTFFALKNNIEERTNANFLKVFKEKNKI